MEIYSAKDIASAARVSVAHVLRRVVVGQVPTVRGYLAQPDAIRMLQAIVSGAPAEGGDLAFSAVVAPRERRGAFGLAASGALHALLAAIVIASSLGLLTAASLEDESDPPRARLVFLMTPGPGGGGGGGGLRIPVPPRRAERKAPLTKTLSSPLPEVRQPPPPPQPRVDPPPPSPPPAVVQAPVVPRPADRVDAPGVPTPAVAPVTNQGPGAGGGAGTGTGAGIGQGAGPGIGAGSGGGEGGGPYQPGAGIDPPSLVREVKASYSDDARRSGIEGEVVLEIVVRRDGSVGDVRIRRSLHPGLDQRAIDAVRQWRFAPARRHGASVDVVVEVAVEFKLR